ncbi:MAG: lipopolysaccharide biosynthesis protein [Bradyrhizobium sp.]|nr:lipopolysaccharide biosynthesis protein [Bradyrhizobium sp.]
MMRSDQPAARQPKLARRAASGAIWLALETGLTQVISLLVFAIMARFFAPSDFGLISITYVAIFSFKSVVIDTVAFAVLREKDATDIEYDSCFWLSLAFSAAGALVMLLSAGTVEQMMQAPHLESVMRAMSVIVLFMGLARTHEMRLARSFRFRTLAIRGIIGTAVGGLVGILLAILGYGLTSLVVQQIATSAISLALLWRISAWIPSFRVSIQATSSILRFMRGALPGCVLAVISQNCDTLLVAYYFGPTLVGLYALAKRLRLALQSIAATPINGVAFPALAEVQDDQQRLRQAALRMVSLISFVCAPIFVGSSSLADEIISMAFGAKWVATAPIFATFTLGGFFASLQIFGDTIFALKAKQMWTFYNLLAYVAMAASMFLILSHFGFENVALPFILPYIVTLPVSATLVSRLIDVPIRQWLAAILPSVASSLLMFGTVTFFDSRLQFLTVSLRTICLAAFGAAVYFSVMMVLGRKTVVFGLGTLLQLADRSPAAALEQQTQ